MKPKPTISLRDKARAVQLLTENAAVQLANFGLQLEHEVTDEKQRTRTRKACQLAGDSLIFLAQDLRRRNAEKRR